MQAVGSVMTNKYSEGYPGARYYGGNEFEQDASLFSETLPVSLLAHPLLNFVFNSVQVLSLFDLAIKILIELVSRHKGLPHVLILKVGFLKDVLLQAFSSRDEKVISGLACLMSEIGQAMQAGETPSDVLGWKKMRYKEGSGFITPKAENDWNKIQNELEKARLEAASSSDPQPVNEMEVLLRALGERRGHNRGVGHKLKTCPLIISRHHRSPWKICGQKRKSRGEWAKCVIKCVTSLMNHFNAGTDPSRLQSTTVSRRRRLEDEDESDDEN